MSGLVVLQEADLRRLIEESVRAALGQRSTEGETLTLRETGVSVRTLRKEIREGRLRGLRVGRELRVRKSDFETWLVGREAKPAESNESRAAAERALERARASGALRRVK